MTNSANRGSEKIIFGNDTLVIQKYVSGIPGGRTLDVADYPVNNIFAGSIVIKKSNGDYAPMPLKAKKNGENAVLDEDGNQVYEYDTLPSGASYVGVAYKTIAKYDPQASIMFDGVVNIKALPYDITAVKAAFSAALPHIIFVEDEEA